MITATFKAFVITDIGKVRKRNEDAYLVNPQLQLFAVADGMGGHKAGDVASQLALTTLEKYLKSPSQHETPEQRLQLAFEEANKAVFQESIHRGHFQGMGTTLTAIWQPPQSSHLWLAHVGDSRCYMLREGHLQQLSHDHSWVQDQLDRGALTLSQAEKHPMRNIITRSIGYAPDIHIDLTQITPQPGDLLLLATDGASNKLSPAELTTALVAMQSDGNHPEALQKLVDLCNLRGGEDNITMLVLASLL